MINIINRDFTNLGMIDDYTSFIGGRGYSSIVGFELHLHEDTVGAEHLIKENILYVEPNKPYIILYRKISSSTGEMVVKGLELKAYLNRWVVFPPSGESHLKIKGTAEDIMKQYVEATLIRKGILDKFAIKPNLDRGEITTYQSRYKNLAEELETLGKANGLGWNLILDLDNKKFVFDILQGDDRTENQVDLPAAIFSLEYDNIEDQELTESRMDYSNTAIVAGQGEGVDRVINIIGDNDLGFDSYELFVDARDLEEEEELPDRGKQKLAEVDEVLNFDSSVLANNNLVYEEDFRLGDIVTIVNNKWGIKADRRIEKVSEISEQSGFLVEVEFGDSPPTIIEKVKRITDAPIYEGGTGGGVNLDAGRPDSNYGGIGSLDGGGV